jgi:cell division protein ZapA (FtsZ GTPase activity inhibitor)
MGSVEIVIGKQKYVVRGEDSQEHLNKVASLVQSKISEFLALPANMPLQRATLLATFDLASEVIHRRDASHGQRDGVLSKATHLLEHIEKELKSH